MKRHDDIQDELKNIAPHLYELAVNNPFQVPDDYFESLPANVLSKIKRQNALVDSLSDNQNREATNPFAVSENYFHAFPNVVMQRVNAAPKIIQLTPNRWKNSLSIAAAVAALMLMSIPLLKHDNVTKNTATPIAVTENLKEVSNDDLYNYLSDDVRTIRVDEIAAGLPDAKLDTLERSMVAVHTASYDDASFDISQIDLDDIESL